MPTSVAAVTAAVTGPEAGRIAYLFTQKSPVFPLSRTWSAHFSACQAGSFGVFLHVDPKFNRTQRGQEKFPVTILEHSIPVDRMLFNMVQARLLLVRAALQAPGVPYTWFQPVLWKEGTTSSLTERAHMWLP